MVYCPECKIANREGSRFCNECGAKLPAAASPTARAAQKIVEPPPLPTEAVPISSDDTPDWLLRVQPTQPANEPTPPPIENTADSDLPDWLKQMQIDTHAPSASSSMAEAAAVSDRVQGDIPDWLTAAQQPQPTETSLPTATAEAEATSAVDTLPDWLRQMQPDTAQSHAPVVAPPPEAVPAAMPAWLTQIRNDTAPMPAAAETDASDMPDWLAPMRHDATPTVAPMPAAAETDASDMPDWLAQMRSDTTSEVPATPLIEPATPSGLAPAAMPDWLSQMQNETPREAAAPPTASAAGGMPSWLSDLQPPTDDVRATTEPEAAGLVANEMPSWLQAMKPAGKIETQGGEMIETTGLLAGVRDALPVEKVFLVSHKPRSKAATAKVHTSTAGFAELATPEAVPPATTALEEKPKPKGWRRWLPFLHIFVIFVVIVFALLLPAEVRGNTIPYQHQASQDFYATINTLHADSLTLIAIDYGAASRGELDAQARTTFLQLLQNKQRFVTLSFVPEGQQIAQSLYDNLPVSYRKAFPYGDYFLNLGYKGGGEAALRALMKPQSVFFKRDAIKGKTLGTDWENFKNVKELNDFGLLIVFSDNAEQVERWVEQVGHPSQKLLLVGATAEITPRIAPYHPGDVKVILSGLRDAAEYELWLNNPIAVNPSTAAGSLDAISYVSLLLIGVMVLGYIASFVGKA